MYCNKNGIVFLNSYELNVVGIKKNRITETILFRIHQVHFDMK